MFVLEHVSSFHFWMAKQFQMSRRVRFAGLILVELGLAPLHSTAGLVNLGGETAVEDFIASQAPQTASEESE